MSVASPCTAESNLDPDTNQWYITTAGWPGTPFGTKLPGPVAIRELDWVGRNEGLNGQRVLPAEPVS